VLRRNQEPSFTPPIGFEAQKTKAGHHREAIRVPEPLGEGCRPERRTYRHHLSGLTGLAGLPFRDHASGPSPEPIGMRVAAATKHQQSSISSSRQFRHPQGRACTRGPEQAIEADRAKGLKATALRLHSM